MICCLIYQNICKDSMVGDFSRLRITASNQPNSNTSNRCSDWNALATHNIKHAKHNCSISTQYVKMWLYQNNATIMKGDIT